MQETSEHHVTCPKCGCDFYMDCKNYLFQTKPKIKQLTSCPDCLRDITVVLENPYYVRVQD